MKLRLFAWTLLSLIVMAAPAMAQQSSKELKKELRAKVERDCRKDAKQLEKDGWKVMPGKLPIEKQMQNARFAELDTDEETGEQLYFIGTHKALGGNYSAAKQIADTRARGEIAQQVNSAIAQKITSQVASTDLGDHDTELVDELVAGSKTIVSAQLQGVVPVLEIYREGQNGQYEVQVTLKADYAKTMKAVKSALKNELKNKSEQLIIDLDKVLPY